MLELLAECVGMPTPVTMITRLRLDAALYDPAPPRERGTKGAPRKKGEEVKWEGILAHVQRRHEETDSDTVRLELDVGGPMPSGAITVVERIARISELETVILNRHGRLRGGYRACGRQ